LNFGRKGVIDMPIKLMVVVLVISLSLPLLADAVERGESKNATLVMNGEVNEIFNAVAAVHYSGIGSSRTVSITIPDGCEISIPGGSGSAGYCVKMTFKGRETGIRYMERPPVQFVTDNLVLSGSVMLLITSCTVNGGPAVSVNVV